MAEIDWNSGQVEMTRAITGWDIAQRIGASLYSLHYSPTRVAALVYAKKAASERGIKLLVEA